MGNAPELIVMLTHNDLTVHNAYDIFDQCRNSRAKFWGFKEEPLPLEQMKKLFRYMKSCGKTTFLEVVAYSEKECMDGAKKAVECNCDFLLGTTFSDSINEFCRLNHIKYMPFVGKITGRSKNLHSKRSLRYRSVRVQIYGRRNTPEPGIRCQCQCAGLYCRQRQQL